MQEQWASQDDHINKKYSGLHDEHIKKKSRGQGFVINVVSTFQYFFRAHILLLEQGALIDIDRAFQQLFHGLRMLGHKHRQSQSSKNHENLESRCGWPERACH